MMNFDEATKAYFGVVPKDAPIPDEIMSYQNDSGWELWDECDLLAFVTNDGLAIDLRTKLMGRRF